jgi:hypothetical protein
MDITMCMDTRCPSRVLCHRYTAEVDTYQSFFAKSPRKKGQMRCEEFWDNSNGADMCRCDMFAMPHKYTPICQLFEVITQHPLPQKKKRLRKRA